MTSDDGVEEVLRRVRWKVRSEVDARVLQAALEAFDEAFEGTRSPAAINPPRKRSFLIRVVLPAGIRLGRHKAGVAAALVAATVLVVLVLSVRPGVTLAEVAAAASTQPWIHLKYDNGREHWVCLAERRFFTRWEVDSDGGRLVDQDYKAGIIRDYQPGTGYISERPAGTYVPPVTPWEYVVGPWERVMRDEKGSAQVHEVEREEEVLDGRQLVRFDVYFNDAAGRRILVDQIWADLKSRLPVQRRKRLVLARREEQGREFITGQYDYPAPGPTSIYDLGAPRGIEIVRTDRPVDEDLRQMIQAAKDAQAGFPDRYMAVVWQDKEGREVDVMYRNGNRMRWEHYFNLARRHPEYCLQVPATGTEVLEWTQGQVPVQIDVFDGEAHYARLGPFPEPFVDQTEPSVRITRKSRPYGVGQNWPHEFLWPVADRGGSPERAPSIVPGCVGLRWGAGNRRQDFYLDPEKDYICVNWIWWRKRGETWEMQREYWLGDFRRLPNRQFYAGKRHLVTYGDPDKGFGRGGADSNVYVRILDEGEFPPDAFDGQELLEGAKVETY